MRPARRQQRGIVAVLVAVALVALIAMVGLATDMGHVALNKSRLQSTVDAAALAAAKVLDQTGSEDQATTAAHSVFGLNAADQPELMAWLVGNDITVQYSQLLSPFSPGTTPAHYVRVRADNLWWLTSRFLNVVGLQSLSTSASAVAGPSAPIEAACDVLPFLICAGTGGTRENHWGGVLDETKVTPLKIAAADSQVPGSTGLICLGDGNCGKEELREWMAGGGCIAPDRWQTPAPGTGAGPTYAGLNARFTNGNPPLRDADYPTDFITTEPNPPLTMKSGDAASAFLCDYSSNPRKCEAGALVSSIDQVSYSYSDYKSDQQGGVVTNPSGRADRRVVALPVVDCSTFNNPRDPVKVVDLACYFLLQRVIDGVSGNPAFVLGQYTHEPCAASGIPGPDPDPGGGTGVYKIILHNDPDSPDS